MPWAQRPPRSGAWEAGVTLMNPWWASGVPMPWLAPHSAPPPERPPGFSLDPHGSGRGRVPEPSLLSLVWFTLGGCVRGVWQEGSRIRPRLPSGCSLPVPGGGGRTPQRPRVTLTPHPYLQAFASQGPWPGLSSPAPPLPAFHTASTAGPPSVLRGSGWPAWPGTVLPLPIPEAAHSGIFLCR